MVEYFFISERHENQAVGIRDLIGIGIDFLFSLHIKRVSKDVSSVERYERRLLRVRNGINNKYLFSLLRGSHDR
jgi:hypothetical protein